MLTKGDKAPELNLSDQDGNTVKLAGFKGRKVCVYFYPKADTPGCTQQSCGLRDIAAQVGDTAIIGISPDKAAKQKKFDDKYELGFPLLADVEHTVAEAYGVPEGRVKEALVFYQAHRAEIDASLQAESQLELARG